SPSHLKILAASLPNLQHISTALHVEMFEHLDEFEFGSKNPSSTRPVLAQIRSEYSPCLPGSAADSIQDKFPKITRFFKSLWPNIPELDTEGKHTHYDLSGHLTELTWLQLD
ncbi:unnamed protein product, partial [Rhizoctonia solani]